MTWFEQARDLPKEDMLGLPSSPGTAGARVVTVAVPRLPRIANFDDLDPLAAEPESTCASLEPGQPLPAAADLVLLPGSKSTLADLAALRAAGWDIDILAHVRRGGWVLGLCGGYQMLGRTISDPLGVEGAPATVGGLGLLAVDTVLAPTKTWPCAGRRTSPPARPCTATRSTWAARTVPGASGRCSARRWHRGAVSADGRVMGCYLHGLLAADDFRHSLLARIRGRAGARLAYEARVEAALEGLAQHLERCLDLDRLLAIAAVPA